MENSPHFTFSPKEMSETAVLLNITLRACTDDPTFAGRFPATTGEYRSRMLNDVYYALFGRDHTEFKKRYGRVHEQTIRPSTGITLSREQREIFLSEVENEISSRRHPTDSYRSILESIASKLKI